MSHPSQDRGVKQKSPLEERRDVLRECQVRARGKNERESNKVWSRRRVLR